MTAAQWFMVGGALLLVVAVAYLLNRPRVDGWFTRGTKDVPATTAEKGDSLSRFSPLPPRPSTAPAVPASVAATPPAAAPSMAPSGSSGGVQPRRESMPAAPLRVASTATDEGATMEDKGIVSAGQLLAGWVLPDEDATPPVQGVPAKRHADLMYLIQMAHKPGGNNVVEDVVIGSSVAVNTVKSYAHMIGQESFVSWNEDGTPKDWSAEADPKIKQAAEASIRATLAGWSARGIKQPTYDFSKYRKPA